MIDLSHKSKQTNYINQNIIFMPKYESKTLQLDKYSSVKVQPDWGVSFYWNGKFTSFISDGDLKSIVNTYNQIKNEDRLQSK